VRDRSEKVRALVRRVVEESRLSQYQLARDSGLSYAALHAWIIGKRVPRPESLLQLAEGLEARAGELQRMAEKVRREAEDEVR
jgi:transcriptional regulator with XRE-family HTH domain